MARTTGSPGPRALPVRLVQKVSSTRLFARLAPRVIPALDRGVHRLSGGRVLLSARMLPGVILTSTGARSGLPRRTPLACVPQEGGGWLLIGSNFGRPAHPAWTGNLLAHPDATVDWQGRDIPVTARLLTGAERAAAWREALALWPPYAVYQSRVEREIRVFRLTRREPDRAAGAREP
ncbi:nitroreductase family deazaflavin-dependent oxidoreductase [Streptomyces achromogenes]|uniref:nitroreductase family deazaflavin-dependent oxidoreductase n=1 Tax=Streptomyces achromogenes TaxID=67255 RepID=UPI0036A4AC46